MSSSCHEFRAAWFGLTSGEPKPGVFDHPEGCPACALWVRRDEALREALASSEPLRAPRELDRRVQALFEGGLFEAPEDSMVTRALRELSPLPAPRELDERVAIDFAQRAAPESWELEKRVVQAVTSLPEIDAPAVLERLVEEELGASDRATSERFVGDLERLEAPRTLDREVGRLLRGQPAPRSWRRTLVLAAAAATLVLGTWRVLGPAGDGVLTRERDWSFEIVRLDRAQSPDPLAEVLARGSGADAELSREWVENEPGTLARLVQGEGLEPARFPQHMRSWAPSVQSTSVESSPSPSSADETRALYQSSATAPLEVAHAGVRRLHLFERGEETTRHLAYRELVVTDGLGNFTLEPFEVLTDLEARPEEFLRRQKLHEGFHFRYRDFAIRDLRLFRKNYELVPLGEGLALAGRAAWPYRIEPREAGRNAFEVALDAQTGIVLRYVELDADGLPLLGMEYESFSLNPPIEQVAFHRATAQETVARPERIRSALRPRLLPRGFEELGEPGEVESPTGGASWLKRVYGDGLQSVFFLSRPAPPSGQPGPDQVLVGKVGNVNTVHAFLGDHEMIAVGKLATTELLSLVDSAQP